MPIVTAKPKEKDGRLFLNTKALKSAALKPHDIVDKLQASLVNSPPPQYIENHLSTPPIIPAIIPALPPNKSPAHKTEASLTFKIASSYLMPNSVEKIADRPKAIPKIICCHL